MKMRNKALEDKKALEDMRNEEEMREEGKRRTQQILYLEKEYRELSAQFEKEKEQMEEKAKAEVMDSKEVFGCNWGLDNEDDEEDSVDEDEEVSEDDYGDDDWMSNFRLGGSLEEPWQDDGPRTGGSLEKTRLGGGQDWGP